MRFENGLLGVFFSSFWCFGFTFYFPFAISNLFVVLECVHVHCVEARFCGGANSRGPGAGRKSYIYAFHQSSESISLQFLADPL